MNHIQNILSVYDQANADEIVAGKSWYAEAKREAQAIADKYELPLAIVVGVIAALSPTNKWDRNLQDADAMCSVFVEGGYIEEVTVCTYETMREKAWSILADMPGESTECGGLRPNAKLVANILRGPKITDFFWCILGHDVCVIDGHAWCIANADRRTMQEVPNIGKKLRQDLQDAYRVAAHAQGLTAYEMQAITWTAWRRIHGVA